MVSTWLLPSFVAKFDAVALLQFFRYFPCNEKLKRALCTTSLKYHCLPSKVMIDWQEKNSCMHTKVQGQLMLVCLIQIH
jgi:hypothetical protein